MKILVASDLHGSAFYARKLIERIAKESPERVILLGDLLYHGPRNDLPEGYAPKEVITLLSSLSPAPLCVRGNCEAEVDQMVLPFPVMDKFRTLSWEGKNILCTHGHRELPDMNGVDILLCGHTHVPKAEERENYLYLNCGSVSIPKENSPHSYLILENGVAVWKDLNGKEFMKQAL
ncbi:MAG: phosphodiesterase [Clostridia bacterium]|nr:phosphodiesterase [Clostridia bacterium]